MENEALNEELVEEPVIAEAAEEGTEAEPEIVEEQPAKKKRPPMSEETKQAIKKTRAEQKAKAENLKPSVIVQYDHNEVDVNAILEAVKEQFHQEKKRTAITDLKLYLKPGENTAYYVINEKYTGKLEYTPTQSEF